jgi:hypothetical protein
MLNSFASLLSSFICSATLSNVITSAKLSRKGFFIKSNLIQPLHFYILGGEPTIYQGLDDNHSLVSDTDIPEYENDTK